MKHRPFVRPKAQRDLDRQAFYLAGEASPKVAYRFLHSARKTFLLLAQHPHIGWSGRFKRKRLQDVRLFSISDFEKMLVLYRPLDQLH